MAMALVIPLAIIGSIAFVSWSGISSFFASRQQEQITQQVHWLAPTIIVAVIGLVIIVWVWKS